MKSLTPCDCKQIGRLNACFYLLEGTAKRKRNVSIAMEANTQAIKTAHKRHSQT